MLANVKEVVRLCQNWLSDYSKKYGVSFIVNPDSQISSVVTSMLCFGIDTSTLILPSLDNFMWEGFGAHRILVGSINRTNGPLNRQYCKRGLDGLADVYPVYDLYESELEQIAKYMKPDIVLPDRFLDREIVEWAISENDKTGIITKDESPIANEKWFGYSMKQKQIISELHQREKSTRHKALDIRKTFLFRNDNQNLFSK